MNLFKKIIIFVGLSLALLLAFQGSETAVRFEKTNSETPLFSENTNVNSAFIQPEVVTHLVTNIKVNSFSIFKFFNSYLLSVPKLEVSKTLNNYALQDINRCNKVSLLLFPYHIFW